MAYKRLFSGSVWKRFLCLAFAAFFCLIGSTFAVEAADEADSLPRIEKWVNGMAVTADGTYLSDTWAVDDTGISTRKYVLVGQNCTEEMRIEKYPEGITDGDTEVCPQYSVSISLVLPEGIEGDAVVTIESEYAVYTVSFQEASGYDASVSLYPGVYKIMDVELAGDVSGNYEANNVTKIDATQEDSVTLEIVPVKTEAPDEDNATTATAPSDNSDEDSSATGQSRTDALQKDTIMLCVVVVGLLIIYAIIKIRRSRAERRRY